MPASRPGSVVKGASGAMLISFSSVFVKLADVGPATAGFYRVLFGTLALALVALLLRRRPGLTRASLLWAMAAGLMFAGDLTVWHKSILSIGPGLATVLANFQVFFMIGISVLFMREAIRLRTIIAVLLAIIGLLLMVGPGWSTLSSDGRAGVMYGLATAVFYTLYMISLRRLQSQAADSDPIWNMALVSACTTVLLAIEIPLLGESFLIPDMTTAGWLITYGILCQGLGWYLIARSLTQIGLAITGIVILLQPALAFLWDVLLFDRPTSTLDLTGATIALVAIYLGVVSQNQANSPMRNRQA